MKPSHVILTIGFFLFAIPAFAQEKTKKPNVLFIFSDDQRAVFVLKDLEGWDTEDIAMHLGISRDLVRQRLHRAHLGMRGHLVAFAAQVRGTANDGAGPSKRQEGGRP